MDPFLIAIILYLVACAFAFIDIFVPSGGMLLILATVAAFAAILFGFRSSATMGMSMLTVVAASVPVFAYVAIRIWPHTPIGKRMILHPPAESGSTAEPEVPTHSELVGKVFLIESALMPSGQIKIGHRRFNAVIESGIAEPGQTVKVIGIRERNLIVRLSSEPASPLTSSNLEVQTPQSQESLLDRPADELGLDSIDE